MRIRYTPRARSDLDSIFSYLDERSPASAIGVKRVIERTIQGLSDFPEIAPPTDFGARALVIGRFPYRVFYRIREGEIHILHVRHTSRYPWQEQDE